MQGKKLKHLILAEGEVTGHAHRVVSGEAELVQAGEMMYLLVKSKFVKVDHEEHGVIAIPQGTWEVKKVREWDYEEEEARQVRD